MPAQPRLYDAFTDLLCRQIAAFEREHPGLLKTAETIYLGGGTPSVLPIDCLKRIFECLAGFGVDAHRLREVSMEFNPESTSQETVAAVMELGVNRISLGLQTFDANLLKRVGRAHTVEAGLSALQLLTSVPNLQVNADLMFDLPGQTVEGFLTDVDKLSDYPLQHISFYGLNVSPRSRLGSRVSRGEITINEDVYEPMYLGGVEILERKGFMRYEVSNFACKGFESVHNQNYWDRGEYAGFGPGAHSYVGGVRFCAPEIYPRWRDYVLSDCPKDMLSVDNLSDEDKLMELIWLSLRQAKGLSLASLLQFGINDSDKLLARCIDKWVCKKYVLKKDDSLCLDGRGWVFMDDIVTDLANCYSNLE